MDLDLGFNRKMLVKPLFELPSAEAEPGASARQSVHPVGEMVSASVSVSGANARDLRVLDSHTSK